MGKKKFQNKAKKLFIGAILPSVLLLSLTSPFVIQPPASAAIEEVAAQRDRTILYALLRCLNPNNDPRLDGTFAANASGADVRSDSMEGIIGSGGFNGDAAVGYEVDSNDGNAACDGISLTRALRPVGKDPRWFFNQFYDLNNLQELSDGGYGYPYRSGVTEQTVIGKIRNLMRSHDLGMSRAEKLRRLAGAFWLCAEEAPDPPDRPTETIGGKKYQLKEGKSSDDEISVGYDMESENGKFQCGTLLGWGKGDPEKRQEIIDALREHPRGTTPGSGSGGGGGADDGTEDAPSCELKLNSPLSWIICPLVELGTSFTDWVFDTFVRGLLEEVPISTDPRDGGYKAWQSFRILANVILVGAMLILVYGMIRGQR